MANIFTRGPQWWQARQGLQAGLANPPRESIVQGAIQDSRRLHSATNDDDGGGNDNWNSLATDFVNHLHRAVKSLVSGTNPVVVIVVVLLP